MKVRSVQREFFVQLLLELEKTGVSSGELLDELRLRGVSALDTSRALLEGAESMVLLETAAELADDPCLALRVGKRLGIASFGTFGFALMSCANLRESIRLLLRYGQLLFEPIWKAYEHDGGLLLRANPTLGTPLRRQLVTELSLSNVAAVGRSLYGRQVARAEGIEVQFGYPRPAHSACYKRCFDTPVKFNCEHSQMFVPAHVFDTPVKTANRTEHVVFQQQCEEMLRELATVEKTTAAVRQLLIQSAGDFLDIAQVADKLHISERTLRRRLDAESASFRAIVEEVKDLLAREYLTATELTVAEIAQLLDYSDAANFRRAFTGWNGITPSEYRQRAAENLSC
ncbi:AraC family transcriptional regulator [Halioglobus maricola]|uniref:AraC family transcriptional regulator n=1 Tax=Halioglobus maricola TaxID=2601894 RepID=A0A5P9NFX5_9GAMM|nr:AraC family transcriptional regulator [Halioglobus maricola]QFU74436.1 AraC family transcriptional regulator [Halioglobus maricola]